MLVFCACTCPKASNIPYRAKLSSGKTFAVFAGFQPIAKVFPLNYLLCTVHEGHGLMHRESFPVNSVFCARLRKFCRIQYIHMKRSLDNRLNK